MVVATKQCRIDKTRTDVGEVDVQSACDSLLLQSLEIDVLHGFRGWVSRSGSQSLRTCDGGDDHDMAFAFLSKVTIGLAYHPSEPDAIGGGSLNLDVFLQCTILFADTWGIEEEIHTS